MTELQGQARVPTASWDVKDAEAPKLGPGESKTDPRPAWWGNPATTECQFRIFLGLPPSDGRGIVLLTAPSEARLEPDWETSKSDMLGNQPDILQAKARLKEVEVANFEPADSRQFLLEFERASLQRAVAQYSEVLARFLLEVDAGYKQFKTATKVRTKAWTRLQAQKSLYEEGRITIDRLLDALSRYAISVASEAQYKSSYNIAIVAFEEAKGTLLEHEGITIVGGPQSLAPVATASTTPTVSLAPAIPTPSNTSATAPPPTAVAAGRTSPGTVPLKTDRSEAKTVTFDLTVGNGSSPIRIRGSFTVAPARETR